MPDIRSAVRPEPDAVLVKIADYVINTNIDREEAFHTAKLCLLDSIACALMALKFPACKKLLGPVVPDAKLANGARVPGTRFRLDPVQGAFSIGTMIRWLDYNDTWLAAEWGHPSDNFGGILALADYLNAKRLEHDREPIQMQEVLHWAIKAYEIQGVLALENSFNRVGLDHVLLVKIATTAVATAMLGGSKEQVVNALSNAWIDGQALRTYRHAPNTGSRKSWAAGDATARGVRLALMAIAGEMGYPSAISAKRWGFSDVLYSGKAISIPREFGSYVMENILFKISFPAEFHAQTAVEAALLLHDKFKERIDNIDKIVIETQEAGMRIIDKTGPLDNPADRDHCIQYMVAVPLLYGRLVANDYEDEVASDTRIDVLRNKMVVQENKQYSVDYLDPEKRSIANSVQLFFKDGTSSEKIDVHYPIGHKRRRQEAIPKLMEKFANAVQQHFSAQQKEKIDTLINELETKTAMSVGRFMHAFYG